jgi:uncharacterized membrane protein YccC
VTNDIQLRLARVRGAWRPLVQSAAAASLSWSAAKHVLGHANPFFAPVSAILALGVTAGQRRRRAVEIIIGVAVGIAVADLLVRLIGRGPAQIAAVVLLAMIAAMLLGGGQLVIAQAATSAVLLATLKPVAGAGAFDRFFDALVGGGVALAISSLLLTTDPRKLVRAAAAPVLSELAAVLDDIAAALSRGDEAAADRALARARGLDELTATLREAVEAARETADMAPPRRGARGDVLLYARATPQIDLAVRNVRVLARGAVRALHLDASVPPDVPEAVRELRAAVACLGTDIERPQHPDEARDHALRAAALATAALERTGNLSVSVIVGQVRSTAVDLLRAVGLEGDAARDAVLQAAREGQERGAAEISGR